MTTEALQSESQTPTSERGGWFGPIFFWDLIRESRKGSSYFPRVVYAAGLLLVLYLVMGRGVLTQNRISGLCYEAFSYYLILQYISILVLTPVYVAGGIIEERQQRTLSLLLTTCLTPREIVLGKMMSRLVPMLGILLAGVPVLAILQLLGGISFEQLIVHSLIALTLLFTVGMHAIRASTLCKTVGGAVASTYATTLSAFLVMIPFAIGFVGGGGRILGVILAVIIVVGGYVLFSWMTLYRAIDTISSRDRDQDLSQSESERQYQPLPSCPSPQLAPVQAPVAQDDPEVLDYPAQIDRLFKPPLRGDRPIVWKETYFPSPDLANFIAFLFSTIPLLVFIAHWLSPKGQFEEIAKSMAFYIESSHVLLTLLLILATLRAAGTLVTERKQQTLISLLTTPLSWNYILLEFYFGSIWRYRWLALGTFLLTICATLFDPEKMLTMLLVYASQLAFFAMLGLAASMVFQTAFQARLMLGVLFIVIFLLIPSLRLMPGSSFFRVFEILLAPYRFWPESRHDLASLRGDPISWEQFAIASPLLYFVFLLANLILIWVPTWLLFRFSRYRLGRILDRGGV
ncbi:MAG TPA: hypothetical protein PLN21_10885 [Gemmatales bacterium]|nr:hypothetical protein [Gemmatales bacterium]